MCNVYVYYMKVKVKPLLKKAAEALCPQAANELTSAYKLHKAYMACKA
jgi:hypothetical protein